MSKSRTLGVYVGLAVDPNVDWDYVCSQAASAGYDTISVFLTTAFYNTGLWPWPLVNKKFDYSKVNPDYRAALKRAGTAAKKYKIKLHLCIVDQFHDYADNPNPDPFRQGLGMESPTLMAEAAKLPPRTHLEAIEAHRAKLEARFTALDASAVSTRSIVEDNSGKWRESIISGRSMDSTSLVEGAWNEEPLYSSWDGHKYTWLGWAPDKDPKYLATPQLTLAQYKILTPFGGGMLRFLQMVANVMKNTGASFSFKWGNETYGRLGADGKPAGSRGDRDECVIWARSIFRAAGLEPDMYFDFLAFKAPGFTVDYPVMHAAFDKGIRKKHKAKLEIHGILTVKDALDFGFTPEEQADIKDSTDGDLIMVGDYPGLGKSILPDVDLKMDKRHVTEKTIMEFFKALMPKYKTYLK